MKQHKTLLVVLLASFLTTGLMLLIVQTAHVPIKPTPNPTYASLLTKIHQTGTLEIIAKFKVDPALIGIATGDPSLTPEELAVQHARDQLLSKPSLRTATILAQSDRWVTPFVSLLVDEPALQALIESPEILGISEVREFRMGD